MTWVLEWLPWLAIAALPGMVNTIVAIGELNQRCRELPFFEPYKVPGVWVWLAIEFLLPAAVFFAAALLTRPELNARLFVDAILIYGIGFTALLNARIKLGAGSYDLKSLYDALIGVAYGMIENSQRRRAAAFWTDLETELNHSPDLKAGLTYLGNYFAIEVRNPQPEKHYQERIEAALSRSDRSEQAKIVKSLLMDVNRRDLIEVLLRFRCSPAMLERHFTKIKVENALRAAV